MRSNDIWLLGWIELIRDFALCYIPTLMVVGEYIATAIKLVSCKKNHGILSEWHFSGLYITAEYAIDYNNQRDYNVNLGLGQP